MVAQSTLSSLWCPRRSRKGRTLPMQGTDWILVVDPDAKAVEDWRTSLTIQGLNVESAGSVREAAKKLKVLQCGCLVIDVDLPEMKGYEAAPILKAIQPLAKVIMTARENSKELESKVRQQDVFYYHIKSFSPSELASAVSDALQASKKDQSKAT